MKRWELLDTAEIPRDGGELRLLKRDGEFAIRIAGHPGELMNSRTHNSEDELATLSCSHLATKKNAHVLIGGLGMGFTLAAALRCLGPSAKVTVAELVPDVVRWNQEVLGTVAGHPLADSRVQVKAVDVRGLIKAASGEYDAILLDVDNGPEGITHEGNDALYSLQGLGHAMRALATEGILAVWSASPSAAFTSKLQKVGFVVREERVRAHRSPVAATGADQNNQHAKKTKGKGKGARHTIWLAQE